MILKLSMRMVASHLIFEFFVDDLYTSMSGSILELICFGVISICLLASESNNVAELR